MNRNRESLSESRTQIFVYGTLKRGFCRSNLLENQTFLSEAVTAPHYSMYDCGDYPGLVLDREAGSSIRGEIWSVDARGVKLLDQIEGVAQNLYARDEIELVDPPDIQAVQAYYYQGNVSSLTKCDGPWTKGIEK